MAWGAQGRHDKRVAPVANVIRVARMRLVGVVVVAVAVLAGASATAGEADVVGVEVNARGGNYSFRVTVQHGDEGWDHYADKWDVIGPDGTVYGTRTLLHPHETEQPFTRSLSGIAIPAGVPHVTIRAHDSVHGDGGAEMTVELP